MTALKKYQKLECSGLWRDTPEAQRREVIVSFGEASLVLTDPRSENALSHWSLPAVERLNPGEMPAVYGPCEDATETLELDDIDMIAALETVRGALAQARPRPGRLRGTMLMGSTLLVLALGVFWLPGALIEHTASVVPPATRAKIGAMALADLARVTGTPCASESGQIGLDKLSQRIFGDPAPRIVILRDGGLHTMNLPGQIFALSRGIVEQNDTPEIAAGYVVAEKLRWAELDPMIPLLKHAGLRATFKLLTTGQLEPDAVSGYAEDLLRREPIRLRTSNLIIQFTAADLSTSPYAYALDPSGQEVKGLIEADPFPEGPPRPVLTDGDWIGLQDICRNE